MELILTHLNADFDAIAAMLAAHKLYPDAIPLLPSQLNHNVENFLALYRSGLPFVSPAEVHVQDVERVILVDTQNPPGVRGIKPDTPIYIIDHHALKNPLKPNQSGHCESVGAATTLLVESIQKQSMALSMPEATLLALGIYEDTGALTYSTTTARDMRAAAWLLEQGVDLDRVRQFLTPPLTVEQRQLFEILLKNTESRTIQGYIITVAFASLDHYVTEISSVTHHLREALDSAGLCVVVEMPENIQIICRTTGEMLDVGEVARYFGGGGHERASAATIRDKPLAEIVSELWQQIELHVRPMARVADLMSFGVQTVAASQPVHTIIQHIRRVGHEGYPVLDNGRVIGLLTRREADRAMEHGLGSLTTGEIMSSGEVTLTPDDSVATLQQRMVESGWGQIPVLNRQGALVGIVTRTDLIKYWAHLHPLSSAAQPMLSSSHLEKVLGQPALKLVEVIAAHAQQAGINLYMVGGVVRDVLLNRPNFDIDFVVESNAVPFAESLAQQFGGRTTPPNPFGTAKWKLDETVAAALHVDSALLLDHIDFATSRNEFYQHPTALPTVYNGSIKLDLQRRDFTINTLAVQLSPASAMWRILDFYAGMQDLDNKLIRVLHSLSFVDDPTRILRAVRFEQRLGFRIEARTAELISTALPMLRRITGERLRNELTLLFREAEPEKGLLNLQARGVLEAIYPSFKLDDQLKYFPAVRTSHPPWTPTPFDHTDVYWHVLACMIPLADLPAWCERLMFGRTMTESLLSGSQLLHAAPQIADPLKPPSRLVHYFENCSELALLTCWIMTQGLVRGRIQRYMVEWRHIHIASNGHTLMTLGIPPGPNYKVILDRLRAARLDGEVTNEEEEFGLLTSLAKEFGNDHT